VGVGQSGAGQGRAAPEEPRRARETFRSFAAYLCEFFGVDRLGAEYIREHVAVQGRENLDRALAGGRGLLFVSAHYSNWELGAFVVGRLGYPILIVAQMHSDPRVNDLFVRQRAAHGVTVAPTAQGARAALRALRENRPVAILGDRPTGGPTVSVTLCGRPVDFPQGPWRLALDTGAPLLPTFVYRRAERDYTLAIGAPLEMPASGAYEEKLRALAQAFAHVLEARLRSDPGQCAAFYPMWGPGRLAGVESGG
jgi:KDO2-lipid IV(A) lauroyltransferase